MKQSANPAMMPRMRFRKSSIQKPIVAIHDASPFTLVGGREK